MVLDVLVAGVAAMALGMAWYGPLFGKQWVQEMGFGAKKVKSMKMNAMTAMAGGLATALVTAFVLKQFLGMLSVTALNPALMVAFWAWLGFQATTSVGAVLWENKSWKLFALNASYQLVTLLAMAAVLVFV